MNVVYLWVLGPTLLFAALALYVVFAGRSTKYVVFRTRTPARTPALGRRALLVNVVLREEPERDRAPA
ncbi:hypothetical protein [Actinomadura algeriensis]|uniref:Uncharacterized protein n=1 Tax=Actinomadura algeriensis TaxID=1679523 RepID=A0ABR9JVT4_9ACTN|nr:hypothetical protein [Actinomadura algeriensis]MBE1534670.1 hypothetical protein [Actinomadura algeriensis]